jgi:hypothetical protein
MNRSVAALVTVATLLNDGVARARRWTVTW